MVTMFRADLKVGSYVAVKFDQGTKDAGVSSFVMEGIMEMASV